MKKSIYFGFGTSTKEIEKIEVVGYFNREFVAFAAFRDPIPKLNTRKIKARCGHYAYVIGNVKGPFGKLCPACQNKKLHKRRIKLYKGNPKKATKINITDLRDMLWKKKILFYTGAGISIAAGIPGLEGLDKIFGISRKHLVDDFIRNLIKNKKKIKKKFEDLFLRSKPTKAHKALKNICSYLKADLATENIDLLHQLTGQKVITNSQLRKWNEKMFKKYDLIVTVGLDRDESFAIKKWKRLGGKVVAINLKPPEYIGEGDFYILGDCQKILPSLEKSLNKLKL